MLWILVILMYFVLNRYSEKTLMYQTGVYNKNDICSKFFLFNHSYTSLTFIVEFKHSTDGMNSTHFMCPYKRLFFPYIYIIFAQKVHLFDFNWYLYV